MSTQVIHNLIQLLVSLFITCSKGHPIVLDQNVTHFKSQLLILSFDGFRFDYTSRYHTPNLDYLAQNGVSAPFGYIPTFVTKTFPTHWSIMTGLYQESHGLIDNYFYDHKLNQSFHLSTIGSEWFGGEPLWITAKKQNKKSKIFFWPGSTSSINGMKADHSIEYDVKIDYKYRLNTLIDWVDKGVDLAMGYFNSPDLEGHIYGAFTERVKEAVEEIDSILSHVIERLKTSWKHRNLTIVVLSDHGMTNLTSNGLIALSDYIDLEHDVDYFSQLGVIASFAPKVGKLDYVYQKLKHHGHPNMTVYLKQDIPKRFHYQNNSRIMPITIFADEGYVIDKIHDAKYPKGMHGYDNQLESMRPIFYAHGPGLKKGYKIEPFDAVNLYSLFCHLLNITPAPNNGSLVNFAHTLTDI